MTSMEDLSAVMFSGTEAPEPAHLVCTFCHPVRASDSRALCGHRFRKVPRTPAPGQHRCARCLALYEAEWPCGH